MPGRRLIVMALLLLLPGCGITGHVDRWRPIVIELRSAESGTPIEGAIVDVRPLWLGIDQLSDRPLNSGATEGRQTVTDARGRTSTALPEGIGFDIVVIRPWGEPYAVGFEDAADTNAEWVGLNGAGDEPIELRVRSSADD